MTDTSISPFAAGKPSRSCAGSGAAPGQLAAAASTRTGSAAGGVKLYTDLDGRRFASVDDLAALCGMSSYDLDHRYRPSNWGMPHDFRYGNQPLQYAMGSLPDLVVELRACGKEAAAAAIKTFIESAVPVESPAAGATIEKKSWAKQWEEEHEQ